MPSLFPYAQHVGRLLSANSALNSKKQFLVVVKERVMPAIFVNEDPNEAVTCKPEVMTS